MHPIISVIIPIYNGSKYISNVVNNILNFNKNIDIEIILINDGSKDNSKELCEEISKKHNNVIFINNEENKGIAETRNIGLKKATGEYITFVDQDDKLLKGYDTFIDKIIKSNADLLIANYVQVYGGESKEHNNFKEDSICQKEDIKYLIRNYLLCDTPLLGKYKNYISRSIWNCIFKKQLIINSNILFKKIVNYEDDFIFLIEFLKISNKVLCLSEHYYCHYYLLNSESHRKQYIKNSFEKRNKLNKYIFDNCIETGLSINQIKEEIITEKCFAILESFHYECNNPSLKNYLKEMYYISNYYSNSEYYEIIHHDLSRKQKFIINMIKNKHFLVLRLFIKSYNLIKKIMHILVLNNK